MSGSLTRFEILVRKCLDCFERTTDRNMDIKGISKDFPGGAVVKNPPVNAGDMGSSPGLGRSHMPWSN